MNIRIMSAVWHDATQYKEGTLLVLLALADWANDEGWCWPSVRQIAAKARLQERQAYNVIRQLESDGVVVRQSGGGRGNATRYRVVVQALENPAINTGFSRERVQPVSVNSAAENPAIGDTKPCNRRHKKPCNRRQCI